MSIKFKLGGYYLRNSDKVRIQLPLLLQPSITELINQLNTLMTHDGVLSLGNDQEDNLKPYKLSLYSDDRNYLVMLETILIDGDIDVRTFYDPSLPQGFMPILGEPYGKQTIIQDFSLVIKVFKEFLETGDVNKDLMMS